ncbi:hypothetical protein BJF93_19080 [Xaviernesmea oryzae]|uniref:Methyl-accepting transducer domain-containing protein n=1 Tax=Xaviernesmea oryzae TaxID=464029 RepID=A0A1Q9B1A2_9HYPH|nr:methyl-accepting chemotaxis protein [Xaviernesmea oryzae]OLP61799.1 hypothetical protein BJF93_19080 [Xaviernesmea oryzae]SEL76968.1 Methyl-accepting chemotaxis protein (MCP) signalling domain-containing protein [Xaviernesmea oryzae]
MRLSFSQRGPIIAAAAGAAVACLGWLGLPNPFGTPIAGLGCALLGWAVARAQRPRDLASNGHPARDRGARAPALSVVQPAPAGPPANVTPFPTSAISSVTAASVAVADAPQRAIARAELESFPVYVDLLNRQLGSVIQVSEGAAQTLLTQLMDVDGRITNLLQFIQTAGNDGGAEASIREIEQRLSQSRQMLTNLVEQQRAAAEDALSHRQRFAEETGSVLEVLDRVHRVAKQTTMLSLNVSIEAARVGDLGKGFAVIGHEIRNLAAEVQQLAHDVHAKVSSLMDSVASEILHQAERREQSEHEAMDDISEAIGALSGNLGTLLSHQRQVLSRVEAENEKIGAPIMAMMGSIQFQDIVRQQIEQLISMSSEVDTHMRLVGDSLEDGACAAEFETLAQRLEAMSGAYVMENQRQDHRTAMGQADAGGAAAVPKIELF